MKLIEEIYGIIRPVGLVFLSCSELFSEKEREKLSKFKKFGYKKSLQICANWVGVNI